MKRVIICIIGCLVVMGFLYAEKVQGEISDSVIRLHILANSNLPEDQAKKLKVRDFVLENYGEKLKAETKEEALNEIYKNLPQMLKDVAEFSGEKVKISVCESEFPTKNYGSFSFPSGKYLSLKIILGNGEGDNWWCVMYPPLCFENLACVTDQSILKEILTKEEFELITKSSKSALFKFKTVEIWNKLKNYF